MQNKLTASPFNTTTAFLFLFTALYACDPGPNDNNNNNSNNHAPSAMVESDVTAPAEGSVYAHGDLIPVNLTLPADEDGDTLNVKVNVTIDDDGVAGKSSGDTSYTEELGSGQPGSEFSDVLDTQGIPLGVGESVDVYAEIVVDDGNGGESSLERMVTVEKAGVNSLSCRVNRANESSAFGMDCTGTPSGETYSIVSSTIADTVIHPNNGTVSSTRGMDQSDGGVNEVVVNYGDATTTVKFSVDPVRAEYVSCDGRTVLMTKPTVDRMAGCIPGFDFGQIPTHNQDGVNQDGIYDVNINEADFACVQTALASAPSEEKEAWASGYQADPEADFAACSSGDQAKVKYQSFNL